MKIRTVTSDLLLSVRLRSVTLHCGTLLSLPLLSETIIICMLMYLFIYFLQDIGAGKGKYYAVNFPLRDGIDDESYESIFVPIMTKVRDGFDILKSVCFRLSFKDYQVSLLYEIRDYETLESHFKYYGLRLVHK